MSTTHDVDDFLAGGAKVPAAKFGAVGDTVVGTVVDRDVIPVTSFETGAPETWPDGNPKLQLVVTLQTDQRDGPEDDGKRRLFAKKPSAMLQAIIDVTAGKGHKLAPGGRLAVQYTGDKPHENPRFNPIKQYRAEYVPPQQAGVDSLLGGDQGAAAPAPQSAASLLG